MDKFPGITEEPTTLHKYACVANDPVDATDATGMISPQSLIVGQAVHNEISEAWENGKEQTTLNGRVANVSISTLVGVGSFPWSSNWLYKLKYGVSTLARPDLAATVEHKIYEIKSIDEFGQGELKLAEYLDLLNALDPMGNWLPGGDDEYTPPSYFYLNNVAGLYYNIDVDPPQGGVITYKWTNADPVAVALGIGLTVGVAGGVGAGADSLAGVGSL